MVTVFSSSPPGNVEARAANASPSGSTFDSANKSALNAATNKIVPCKIQPGPSSATVPLATKARPFGPDCKTTAKNANNKDVNITNKWVNLLFSFGRKASIRTPAQAAKNIIKIGDNKAYSKLGVGMELTTFCIIWFLPC